MNLTHDQIDKMEAGPELDALVHEKVMGNDISEIYYDSTLQEIMPGIPPYSTDISAAWMVVEKMKESLFRFTFKTRFGGGAEAAEFTKRIDERYCRNFYSEASTAPLAICRAALKAIL